MEIANILILAFASGVAKEDKIPVNEKSKVPMTLIPFRVFSTLMFAGIISSRQTIDNSSLVLLMERNHSFNARSGIFLFFSKWQIPNFSGIIDSESFQFMAIDNIESKTYMVYHLSFAAL